MKFRKFYEILILGRPHKHGENPAALDLKGVSALPNSSSLNQGLTPRNHYEAYPERRPLRQQLRQPPNDPYTLREDDRRYGIITKPKVITVVRGGRKPYANIKILLNRRSVQSFERLLSDISESFGPKWKNNKVKRLFTITGREILSISDFFRGDSVFVAISGDGGLQLTDIQDIIENLYPESPYAKSLLRNIEKQKRKAKQSMLQSLANHHQELQGKQGDDPQEKKTRPQKPVKRAAVDETSTTGKENEPKPETKGKRVMIYTHPFTQRNLKYINIRFVYAGLVLILLVT